MTKYQEAYLTLNLGDYSTQLFIDITIYNKPVPMDLLPVAMQVSLLQLCPPHSPIYNEFTNFDCAHRDDSKNTLRATFNLLEFLSAWDTIHKRIVPKPNTKVLLV